LIVVRVWFAMVPHLAFKILPIEPRRRRSGPREASGPVLAAMVAWCGVLQWRVGVLLLLLLLLLLLRLLLLVVVVVVLLLLLLLLLRRAWPLRRTPTMTRRLLRGTRRRDCCATLLWHAGCWSGYVSSVRTSRSRGCCDASFWPVGVQH